MADQLSYVEKPAAEVVQDAHARLAGANGKLVLDFSCVRRIDAKAIRDMETLARLAEEKGVKLLMSRVSVEVYRVLKAMKLASRFCFTPAANGEAEEAWKAAADGANREAQP